MKLVSFYPELPPSSNHIYYNRGGGGRGLSAKAKKYKERFVRWLAKRLMEKGLTSFSDEVAYEVRLLFVLPEVLNATWPKKAKARFKKIDPDNRVKLVLDGISKTIGVDDSAFFSVTSMKCDGPDIGVGILIRQLPTCSQQELVYLFLSEPQGVDLLELDDFFVEMMNEYLRR